MTKSRKHKMQMLICKTRSKALASYDMKLWKEKIVVDAFGFRASIDRYDYNNIGMEEAFATSAEKVS